jgi:molybdate transport system substrate-binding protein
MKIRWHWILAGLLLLQIRAPGGLVKAETISVSAAVSLREVLTEIAGKYQSSTGDIIDLNFGASGALAAQIKQGAPVDLFISAGGKPVDDLVAGGVADRNSRQSIAGNRLVLIVTKDCKNPPAKFEDLAAERFKHIAIGEPKVVPAGEYAMQTLKALNLDIALRDRLVMGENVRQVLVYVMHGEADAGIVYATDAMAGGDAVKVVATAEASTHDPIEYPAVLLQTSHRAAAENFLKYLASEPARKSLAAHGFELPPVSSGASTIPPATRN